MIKVYYHYHHHHQLLRIMPSVASFCVKKEEVQHAQANDTIKRCVERLVSKGSNNLFSLLLVFFLDEDDGVCFRYKQMYLRSCLLSLHSSRVSPRLCILLSSLALSAIAYLGRVDRDRVKRERERCGTFASFFGSLFLEFTAHSSFSFASNTRHWLARCHRRARRGQSARNCHTHGW